MSRPDRRAHADALTARLAAICAAFVAALAALVLLGWVTGIEAQPIPAIGPFVMLPNTAVNLLLSAVALWLRARGSRAAAPFGVLVIAFGVAVIIEQLFDVDLGFDLLLFPDLVRSVAARSPNAIVPGRVALNSGICFTLVGTALVSLDVETKRGRRPSELATTLGLVVTLVAVLGYLYGARPLYTLDRASGMALSTAIGFATLYIGLLAVRAPRGVGSLFMGTDLGAVLARRMLPAVVLLPLLFGWLWLRGRERELFTREGGVALFVAATIGTLTVVLLLLARTLRLVDRSRTRSHEREAAARTTAEAASRAKSDFLAVMSHELRTPLNAILGYVSLLDEGVSGPVTDLQRRQLSRVRAGATHLVGLIDEILTLSRIDAGRETVRRTRIDVATALDDAAAMAAPQAAAKGLAFVVQPPAIAFTIDTDAAKLRQILLNLLANAVKFTDRGEVALLATMDDGAAVFQVRDTGMGIAPEYLDRIFEPFWQVEQRAAHRAAGTGLGLDVSRRLAELLGGSLSVRSAVGEGSTFTLTVPAIGRAE